MPAWIRFILVVLVGVLLAACSPAASPGINSTSTPAPTLASAATATQTPTAEPEAASSQPVLAEWRTYTSEKYGFSIDYPSDWQVLVVPNAEYATSVEQVWFASGAFPPPQTGARPDVAITILPEDPINDWQPQFFDDYQSETIEVGGVPGVRISGINKEMGSREMAVILAYQPGVYLLINSYDDPDSRALFEAMLASFRP